MSKNLLPGEILKRVALTLKSFNIKPRLSLKFHRLTNISSKAIFTLLLAGFLLGYYPTPTFPPVKRSIARAQDEVKQEIIASSFPQPIILPHPGYLSEKFSNYHPGIDIAIGIGMPIHSINPGVVEDVIYDWFDYGHHVIVNHQNGFKSMYAHMGRVYVKKGDKVTTASMLGEVGLTGHTSGAHTHLEITKDGNYIDPLTILPPLPNMPAMK